MKKKIKIMAVTAMSAISIMLFNVAAYAAESVDVAGAISTGVSTVQTQAFSAINAVAPVAIAICGAIVGVKVALRAFRSVVG